MVATAKTNLNPKHKAFAEAYISNGANAYQAALDAGYAESTAKKHSYALLRNKFVQEYITKRRKELAAQAVTPERVLLELADIGFGQKEFPAYTMAGEKVNRLPSMTARLKALEMMGRNLGIFTEKLDVNAVDTGQLESILIQLKEKKNG